jgi:hypothetical protein
MTLAISSVLGVPNKACFASNSPIEIRETDGSYRTVLLSEVKIGDHVNDGSINFSPVIGIFYPTNVVEMVSLDGENFHLDLTALHILFATQDQNTIFDPTNHSLYQRADDVHVGDFVRVQNPPRWSAVTHRKTSKHAPVNLITRSGLVVVNNVQATILEDGNTELQTNIMKPLILWYDAFPDMFSNSLMIEYMPQLVQAGWYLAWGDHHSEKVFMDLLTALDTSFPWLFKHEMFQPVLQSIGSMFDGSTHQRDHRSVGRIEAHIRKKARAHHIKV